MIPTPDSHSWTRPMQDALDAENKSARVRCLVIAWWAFAALVLVVCLYVTRGTPAPTTPALRCEMPFVLHLSAEGGAVRITCSTKGVR